MRPTTAFGASALKRCSTTTARGGHDISVPRTADAMNRYERLFKDYVAEMRRSMNAANEWWDRLQTREIERTRIRKKAMAQLEERWPFGPASHPFVLATYRKYFL